MQKEIPIQSRTTVVHIEADRSNALLMQFLLGERADYVLHHASDGLSGLELCRRVRPDMVITEIHLPDVTGYEVLRALRNEAVAANVPCIAFSSDAMPAHIEQALASGFDGYWIKPIEIWQLMQKIEDVAAITSLKYLRRGYAPKMSSRKVPASQPVCRTDASLKNYFRAA